MRISVKFYLTSPKLPTIYVCLYEMKTFTCIPTPVSNHFVVYWISITVMMHWLPFGISFSMLCMKFMFILYKMYNCETNLFYLENSLKARTILFLNHRMHVYTWQKIEVIHIHVWYSTGLFIYLFRYAVKSTHSTRDITFQHLKYVLSFVFAQIDLSVKSSTIFNDLLNTF